MYRLKPSALDAVQQAHDTSSATHLAALLGVSEGTVRNLRRGSHQPSLETVMTVYRLTGIPVNDLVVEVEHPAA